MAELTAKDTLARGGTATLRIAQQMLPCLSMAVGLTLDLGVPALHLVVVELRNATGLFCEFSIPVNGK